MDAKAKTVLIDLARHRAVDAFKSGDGFTMDEMLAAAAAEAVNGLQPPATTPANSTAFWLANPMSTGRSRSGVSRW